MATEASTPSGAEDPSRFLRGVLPAVSWSAGSRLPPAATAKLTIDTVRAARVPAAVHFAFTGTARAVEVAAEAGEGTSVPAPTLPEAFVARVPGQPAVVVPLPARGQPARIPLPERDPAAVVRLYLPEGVELRVSALSAIDGDIVPGAPGAAAGWCTATRSARAGR